MKKLLLMFLALLTVMVGNAAGRKINIMDLPPFERAVIIIKKFETLHKPKHWPTIGFGHVVQRGEPYRKGIQLTERQADALLRKDLRKFVSLYKHMGERNAILLGTLAYNIGPGAVNRSTVYKKLKRGDTNIYKEYTAHCHYKGKFHKQLHQRRQTELFWLYHTVK